MDNQQSQSQDTDSQQVQCAVEQTISPIESTQEMLDQCLQTEKLAADRLTQLQYLQADFDNLKKQSAKEKIDCIKFANEDLITSLLSVLDSFDKALEVDKSEGLEKLYVQLFQILEKNGLKKIVALGQKFDPYYHEVLVQEKSEQPEGTIIEEVQKGYLLNSKVIRNSKVIISGGNENG